MLDQKFLEIARRSIEVSFEERRSSFNKDLSRKMRELQKSGNLPRESSSGAKIIQELCANELKSRAEIILESLKHTHESFGSQLNKTLAKDLKEEVNHFIEEITQEISALMSKRSGLARNELKNLTLDSAKNLAREKANIEIDHYVNHLKYNVYKGKQKSTESDSSKILTLQTYEKQEKYGEGVYGQGPYGDRSVQEGGAKLSHKDSDESTIEEASIGAYSISDQATDVDSLGFEPYTTAIAEFLGHERTRPPITMSIEGEWGSGKSSFMLQLEEKLVSKGGLIVTFSPWRHEEEDSVWAAFVLTFMDQLSEQLSERSGLRECLKVRFKLLRDRFDWRKGWHSVAKIVAQCFAYLFILIGVITILWAGGIPYLQHIGAKLFLTVSSIMGLAWKGLKSVQDFVGNPFGHDLKKYIQTPDYTGRTPFIEQFHKDFKKVVEAYAGGKKVYVLIDDLDRCAVPKAAELMQAINLMISDDPQLIFVLGMDREKVAAGLAVKHKEVIPYLNPRLVGQEANERLDSNELTGLRYGYSFIEKFVQLPFSIPRPTEDQIEKLMDSIAGKARVEGSEMIPSKDDVGVTVKPDKGGGRELGEEEEPERSKESLERSKAQDEGQRWLELRLAEDSEQVKQIVKMVAPALDCNPRRIKQFINLFRLRAYIAYETEILALPENIGDSGRITLEQLGKIVAISLKWPLLLESLGRDGSLLEDLANVAEKHKVDASVLDDASKRWAQDRKLMELIHFGCLDKEGKQAIFEWSTYTLSQVDINKLLQVSPQVKSISEVDSTIETVEPEGESESSQSPDEDEKGLGPSVAMREYQAFYNELLDRIKEKHPEIKRKKSLPQSWLTLPVGHSNIHIELAFHGRPRSWFEVGLHFEKSSLEKNRKLHDHFLDIKSELESELGSLELTFECPWRTKWARIYVRKDEREMSKELGDWAVETVLKFYDVFKPRLDKFIRSKTDKWGAIDKGKEITNVERVSQIEQLRHNSLAAYLMTRFNLSLEAFHASLTNATSINDFAKKLGDMTGQDNVTEKVVAVFKRYSSKKDDLNEIRKNFGLWELE